MYDAANRAASSASSGSASARPRSEPGKQTLTSGLPPQPTGATGGAPVNADPAVARGADAAPVAQGVGITALFGVPRGSGAAPDGTAAATSAPAATPVPPEVLSRVGAEFLHTEDQAAKRHYRITAGGGFLLIAASSGSGVGELEFRQDNQFKDAWTTLAAYVVKEQATIPPTVAAPAQGEVPAATPEPAAPDPLSFEGITGAIGSGLAAAGDALAGVVQRGVTLLGAGIQAIEDAVARFVGATPAAPAGTTPAEPGATPAPETGTTPAPAAPVRQPTTTTMVASVGTGGANQLDDVTLVQSRLGELGYACTSTGVLDDATVLAIRQYQAALVARTAPLSTNLVAKVDGLISKGRDTEKSLFGDGAQRFTPLQASGAKLNKKAAESTAATGQARTYWDNILAIWAAVSLYLPDGSNLSSGYRSFEDQVRVIEDFFTRTKAAGGYKEAIIAAHGEAEWQALVGKTDDASVATKRSWVDACGQDVATPGSSPHQSGHAIDVGGEDDNGQILALLRYHIDIAPGTLTKILHEKNGCVHFEFA